MDTTRQIEDAVIVKAAFAWNNHLLTTQAKGGKPTRAEVARAEGVLHAYATVAADILNLANSPFGFELAIREAVFTNHLSQANISADAAQDRRMQWAEATIAKVRSTLVR